ncbi:REP-associated tyrosine transposase [Segetibacter aerophilus]|uniref:Transposase n=1 Tax=Segetibacter aerophilus TaxID=670293 RepID=A0A512BA30_9BACT|nr:transposase [Segetibacter aerophilus]GEO08677.1 transposase [Segetibacter aerophilus]
MKDDGYKIRDQHAVHFITFGVVEWVDVFTRRTYADIAIQSLLYCINNKELRLHGWCIMSNHIHLIISTANGNLSDILRDFKKFTSKEIITTIENNKQESRKNWMLWIFKKAGEKNSRNKQYQFWQQDNHPILLETVEFTLDKLNYMHNNPVKAGIVEKAEEYLLSSARDYYHEVGGLLPIDHLTAAYTLRPI